MKNLGTDMSSDGIRLVRKNLLLFLEFL